MIRTALSLVLSIGLAVSPAAAAVTPATDGRTAPPATQVRATVFSATTLANAVLARTPASGDAAALTGEVAIFQYVAASGLGEVMGWGQDYYDALPAAMTKIIVANFQAAYSLLTAMDEAPSYAKLHDTAGKLTGNFHAMNAAVGANGDSAQAKREVAELAKLLAFHVHELPGSPLVSDPKVGIQLLVRMLQTGVPALQTALTGFPQLTQAVTADLAALAKLAQTPPAGADAAALKKLADQAQPALDRIEKALK